MSRLASFLFRSFALLGALHAACPSLAGGFTVPEGFSEVQRARFERFKSFQIKGVCGDGDLVRLSSLGVNTVRGYSIPSAKATLRKLDQAQGLGMKMVVSEWMPHQGKNNSRSGAPFDFDYETRGDEVVAKFMAKVEQIGDHPALLMWGLGNEVHLDEAYLRTANRMSLAIHARFPHHLTSLTMVNAKDEAIEAIKKHAPDIDVLGIQSYSRGAVRGSIRNTEKVWGKPFYLSEFNTNGPWNFGKTEWGVPLDEPVSRKVEDLKDCYASINASPLCLGSTIFIWGHAVVYRPTYFSLVLDPNPNGPPPGKFPATLMMTPQADVMVENFTGNPPAGNRAPILTNLEFAGGANARVAAPGEKIKVSFAAQDANGDKPEFVAWILDASSRLTSTVSGPFAQADASSAVIPAPEKPGHYLVMVYARDNRGGASASTISLKVPEPAASEPGKPHVEKRP